MEDSDAPGEADDNKRKWVFGCSTPTSAQFVGFTIGPFEQVDLSGFRESDQDEIGKIKLGSLSELYERRVLDQPEKSFLFLIYFFN